MADRHTYQDRLDTATATIADGESLSDVISLGGFVPVGVMVPAENWTSAVISFQGSIDGKTFVDVYDDGGEYTTTELAYGQGCSLVKDVFRPWRYIRIRSGKSDAPVAQSDDDVLILILEAR